MSNLSEIVWEVNQGIEQRLFVSQKSGFILFVFERQLCSGTRRLWKQLITMLDRRPTCLGDMERSDQRSRCQSKAASEWFLEQKKLFIEQLFQSFGNGCSSAVEHLWFRVLVPECWAFFWLCKSVLIAGPLPTKTKCFVLWGIFWSQNALV